MSFNDMYIFSIDGFKDDNDDNEDDDYANNDNVDVTSSSRKAALLWYNYHLDHFFKNIILKQRANFKKAICYIYISSMNNKITNIL